MPPLTTRILHPEWLDVLPEDDVDARRSRRDLLLVNNLMGNWRWVADAIARHAPPRARILEIGAGRGDLARWWMTRRRRQDGRHDVTWSCLDRLGPPPGWSDTCPWISSDLLTFAGYEAYDIVVSVLTLHHFTGEELGALGRRMLGGRQMLLAAEPARRRRHWIQAHALTLLGVNRVTRHDAPVSVAAGFRNDELVTCLGLNRPSWNVSVATTFRGAYRLLARPSGRSA